MLLDFFATFFASATALLPIFAQDILHVGARGYGLLSAAPSVGAILASLVMVRMVDRIEQRGPVAAVGDRLLRPGDRAVRLLDSCSCCRSCAWRSPARQTPSAW